MKLNLDNPNVFEVDMTVDQARNLLDIEMDEDLTNALDSAQGEVFTKNVSSAYVVIKIT